MDTIASASSMPWGNPASTLARWWHRHRLSVRGPQPTAAGATSKAGAAIRGNFRQYTATAAFRLSFLIVIGLDRSAFAERHVRITDTAALRDARSAFLSSRHQAANRRGRLRRHVPLTTELDIMLVCGARDATRFRAGLRQRCY